MAMPRRKLFPKIAVFILLLGGAAFFSLPGYVGPRMNPVVGTELGTVSDEARELHGQILVADLHADALLWNRDLTERGDWGHVDLPRMGEGRVGLQAFTVVTKTPRGMNIDATSGDSDNITLLAVAQRWPTRTWRSLLQRALYQSEKLRRVEAESGGGLRILRTRRDLERLLAARAAADARSRHETSGSTTDANAELPPVGAILGIEGAHALDGELSSVDRLFDAGFRMIGITHFFDNAVGGSAHGMEKGGLTPLGVQVVDRMAELETLRQLAANANARLYLGFDRNGLHVDGSDAGRDGS